VGGLEKYMGSYPAITMGVQVVNPLPTSGSALLAKMSLTRFQACLKPLPGGHADAGRVIDSNGFLIAHFQLQEIYKPNAKLRTMCWRSPAE